MARLAVVRLPVAGSRGAGHQRWVAKPEAGRELFARLSRGRYALLGGSPGTRSASPPAWLVHPGGKACARFEDRRLVRRLIADDGSELRPAYLCCFAFEEPRAAVELVAAALGRAAALGFRAVRIALPPSDFELLRPALGNAAVVPAQGAVFASAAAQKGIIWNLNAAEI